MLFNKKFNLLELFITDSLKFNKIIDDMHLRDDQRSGLGEFVAAILEKNPNV